MMDFIMMTISFTLAILLASGLAVVVCTNKVVMKWYMKRVNNMMEVLFEDN